MICLLCILLCVRADCWLSPCQLGRVFTSGGQRKEARMDFNLQEELQSLQDGTQSGTAGSIDGVSPTCRCAFLAQS